MQLEFNSIFSVRCFLLSYNLTCIAVVHVVVVSDALAIAINVHSLSVIYSNVPVNSEQKPFHKS